MRATSTILYIAIDDLLAGRGAALPVFAEFCGALERNGTPAVWLSSRTRLQLDSLLRKLSHAHPFIAEDGCGIFWPPDYFHLRPEGAAGSRASRRRTVRMGRFTCLPVAEPQPATAEMLESLAEDSGIGVVPLRSLTPGELAMNSGLPTREAELARHRDFDELFFFAGATAAEVERFKQLAAERKSQVREQGSLQSLAKGASIRRCVEELSKLYDRALHGHARSVALAVEACADEVVRACDRAIVLTARESSEHVERSRGRVMEVPIHAEDCWERVLEAVAAGVKSGRKSSV